MASNSPRPPSIQRANVPPPIGIKPVPIPSTPSPTVVQATVTPTRAPLSPYSPHPSQPISKPKHVTSQGSVQNTNTIGGVTNNLKGFHTWAGQQDFQGNYMPEPGAEVLIPGKAGRNGNVIFPNKIAVPAKIPNMDPATQGVMPYRDTLRFIRCQKQNVTGPYGGADGPAASQHAPYNSYGGGYAGRGRGNGYPQFRPGFNPRYNNGMARQHRQGFHKRGGKGRSRHWEPNKKRAVASTQIAGQICNQHTTPDDIMATILTTTLPLTRNQLYQIAYTMPKRIVRDVDDDCAPNQTKTSP